MKQSQYILSSYLSNNKIIRASSIALGSVLFSCASYFLYPCMPSKFILLCVFFLKTPFISIIGFIIYITLLPYLSCFHPWFILDCITLLAKITKSSLWNSRVFALMQELWLEMAHKCQPTTIMLTTKWVRPFFFFLPKNIRLRSHQVLSRFTELRLKPWSFLLSSLQCSLSIHRWHHSARATWPALGLPIPAPWVPEHLGSPCSCSHAPWIACCHAALHSST